MSEQKSKEEMEDLARHVKLLQTIALLVGVPAFDVWAVISDAFVHTCERKKPLPAESSARKALLLKIFRFRIYRYFSERTRMRTRALRAHEHATVIATTYARDSSEVLEARQLVEMVTRSLTPEQLDVITEKVLDELSVREVAERLEMRENTVQSHWQRGCAKIVLEMEKLDHPKHGKVRSVLVFVGISSILTAARNASAMFDWVVKFFRYVFKFGSVPTRAVSGVATVASLVIVGPGQSGAAADKPPRVENQAASAPDLSASAPSSSLPMTVVVASVPAAKPSTTPSVAPKWVSRKPMTDSSTDALIAMAKSALGRGDAQRALMLLDQISLVNTQSEDAAMVNGLRAAAKKAIEAKLRSPSQ